MRPFEAAGEAAAARGRELLGGAGPVVTFMGLTGYPPNREAVHFLVDEVMPLVRREIKDARLAVIGGEVDRREDWLTAPGTVPYEDIPGVLAASDVCAAPIFSGSGTRLKILEYMAAARPVVATRKGAEGLDVEDGADITLAETARETADGIITLLRDRASADRMGLAGRRLVSSGYDWKRIASDFQTELAMLFAAGGEGAACAAEDDGGEVKG